MPVPLPELPEGNTTICLVIPDSPEWRQIYMGSLILLQQWWYYGVTSPVDAEDVIQRVMECHYLTSADYEECLEVDCQDIIDCIDDPESGVSDAIFALVESNNSDELRNNAQGTIGSNLVGDNNPTCDDDILWGQCIQLVEYLHQLNVDMLELIEVLTNPIEATAQIMPQGTSASGVLAGILVDWVAFVQQNISDNYDAQITQEYLEACACAVFCQARENSCEVNIELLYEVWQDRLNSTININSVINETLLYLISGIWTGNEIADFMFFAQLALRAQLGYYIGRIAFTDIYTRVAIYGNDPSDDWQIICDECAWSHTFDFEVSEQGWELFASSSGVWVNGVGWQTDGEDVSIIIPLTNPLQLTSFSFDYTISTIGAGTPTKQWYMQTNDDVGGQFTLESGNIVSTGDFSQSEDTAFVAYDRLRLSLALDRGSTFGTGQITSCTVTGVGVDPFA